MMKEGQMRVHWTRRPLDNQPYACVEFGQGLSEYALIIALVALAVAFSLGAFGDQLGVYYDYIVDNLPF